MCSCEQITSGMGRRRPRTILGQRVHRCLAANLNPEDKCVATVRWRNTSTVRCSKIIYQTRAWRQKEQFSDGVGYDWIDTLKATAEAKVTDKQMETAQFRYIQHAND
ncbi:hypothetical protein OH492_06030 [Vibrio chagasii]|nr:hypothetical protein [Vibrio chagasii]